MNMSESQETTQTPPTTNTETTAFNAGRGRGRGGGRGGGGRGGRGSDNFRQRRASNLQAIINTDRNFEGKVPKIGVIGLASERNLKNGLQLGDFTDSIMNYVGTNWEKGNDLKPLIHHLQHPEKYIEEPPDEAPDKDKAAGKYEKWKNKVNLHDKRIDNLEDNKVKLYNLVIGQCTPNMEIEIRGDKKFTKKDRGADALWLLKTIKKIASGVTLRKNETQTYLAKVRDLLAGSQKQTETMESFQKRITAEMDTVELAGGENFFLPDIKVEVSDSESEKDSSSDESDSSIDELDSDEEIIAKGKRNEARARLRVKRKAEKDKKKVEREKSKDKRKVMKIKKKKKEMVRSMIIMQQADRMRYGDRYDELDRATDLGRDEFPTTVYEAVDILTMEENRLIEQHNRTQTRFNSGGGGRGTNGASFAQITGGSGRGNGTGRGNQGNRNNNGQFCIPVGETPVAGKDGTIVCFQCWTCGSWGHTNRNANCPNGETTSVSNMCVNSVTFNTMISDFYLNDTIYLLDSAATHSTVKSKTNLTNLTNCNVKDRLFTLTNAGSIEFNSRGSLNFLPLKPHYNINSVANILVTSGRGVLHTLIYFYA